MKTKQDLGLWFLASLPLLMLTAVFVLSICVRIWG